MISKWKSDFIQLVIREPEYEKFYNKARHIFKYNGLSHNIDFPAIILYTDWECTNVYSIFYNTNNKLHRPMEDGPCSIGYYDPKFEDNKEGVKYENFSITSEYDRIVNYHPSSKWKKGYIESIKYIMKRNISLHRPTNEGPALIKYYSKFNRIKSESYYVNGKLHRPIEEGPAFIVYSLNLVNGKQYKKYVKYYVDDKLVEIDGYIGLEYDSEGNIAYKIYCKDDEYIYKPVNQMN